MLALKIIATIFLGISFLAKLINNALDLEYGNVVEDLTIVIRTYGLLWRAFVLVTIWVV